MSLVEYIKNICTPGIVTTIGDPSFRCASFGMTGCYGSGRGKEGDFAQQNHLPFLLYDPHEFVIPNEVRDLLSFSLNW